MRRAFRVALVAACWAGLGAALLLSVLTRGPLRPERPGRPAP